MGPQILIDRSINTRKYCDGYWHHFLDKTDTGIPQLVRRNTLLQSQHHDDAALVPEGTIIMEVRFWVDPNTPNNMFLQEYFLDKDFQQLEVKDGSGSKITVWNRTGDF